ncbi:MAG: hypothetical protein IMY73_05140 [Bacteroidetes bacterium]|nr:hypothetical protein [Bacteroidota bacterium]
MKRITTTLFSLLIASSLLVISCAKESSIDDSITTKTSQEETTPKPCIIGQMEVNGQLVDHVGDVLTEADIAAAEMATKADQKYTIPIVFHVFGKTQGSSGTLNAARFEKALKWINNDYNGISNPKDKENWNTINSERKNFSSTLNIEFVMAKFDEKGEALVKGTKYNGGTIESNDAAVLIYSTSQAANKIGLGNWSANTQISKISWDNKMYMNVYITHDLYANGGTNSSGVSWYPDIKMTKAGTARVVYNGEYLPGGKYWDPDFTSVITHEFGHFMYLAHPFNEQISGTFVPCKPNLKDGGTFGHYGDGVEDTPQMENSSRTANGWKKNMAYWGHGKKNCLNEIIDFGNFMNYGVYCNFTKGQVARMKAALAGDARNTLWTAENLEKTLGIVPSSTLDERIKDLDGKL